MHEKGSSSTQNADLLRLADQEMFEVFLTTDQHLKDQQNLTQRRSLLSIADDQPASDAKHTAKIAAVLDSIAPAEFIEIDF